MTSKKETYQIVDRGETLPRYVPGGWVFFRRAKECGGGYWLGKTYDGYFLFEFDQPVKLSAGIQHLALLGWQPPPSVDDFELV